MAHNYLLQKGIYASFLRNSYIFYTCRQTHSRFNRYGFRSPDEPTFKAPKDQVNSENAHPNVFRLISAYRSHGHMKAKIDPLGMSNAKCEIPQLEPTTYGLDLEDNLNSLEGLLSVESDTITVNSLVEILNKLYCGKASIELGNIKDEEQYRWLCDKWENMMLAKLDDSKKKNLLKHLIYSELFDQFVAGKLSTLKRYGNEGSESVMAFFLAVLDIATKDNVQTIVMGQGHRGRSNMLVGLFDHPLEKMFRKMKGLSEFPDGIKNTGDVLSHLTSSVDLNYADKSIHVTILPNPSHLEAVNPVAMGKTRAKQQNSQDGFYSTDNSLPGSKVICVQAHGDAAFAGQGIVAETLQLSSLPHYDIGGTIHVIINNQVGFTTPPRYGRSTLYATDIAKSFDMPVFHVNADDPELVYKVSLLASEYQRKFRKDILVDYVCFRRHGHNELDDPTFTNPGMYKIIHNRKSIPESYSDALIKAGIVNLGEVSEMKTSYRTKLNEAFKRSDTYKPEDIQFKRQWSSVNLSPNVIHTWDTGVDNSLLKYIGAKSVTLPSDFKIHERLLNTHIKSRFKAMESGKSIDWATAESLALGSLLYQGNNIRLSGQDIGRGTFSHRHVSFVDQVTEKYFIPLNNLFEDQKHFIEVVDSPLSEEAVLGFEYGFSIDRPDNLVIWEAQFGDFFNTAQVIIDTFIASGETKWLLQSSLVLTLPHGYDGAGPEHSSCRIERFLQLCDSHWSKHDGDDINMCIANPTLPSQYFHLLRKQQIQQFRKPLIIVAPKTLLRLSEAVSDLNDMGPGTHFLPVIGDSSVNIKSVKKVVLCSGKHYYFLKSIRDKRGITDIGLIRIEQLCPFPAENLHNILKQFNAEEIVWSQEEPENMGAWSFIQPRVRNLLGVDLKYNGRPALAAPAVGVSVWHKEEVQELVSNLFG